MSEPIQDIPTIISEIRDWLREIALQLTVLNARRVNGKIRKRKAA